MSNFGFSTSTIKNVVGSAFLGEDTSQSTDQVRRMSTQELRYLESRTGTTIRSDADLANAYRNINGQMRDRGIASSRTADGMLRGETDEGSVYGSNVFKREGYVDPEESRYRSTYKNAQDKARAIDAYYNDARQLCSNVGAPNTYYLHNKKGFDDLLQRIIDRNEADLYRLMAQCEKLYDQSSDQLALNSLSKVASLGRSKMFNDILDQVGPGYVSDGLRKVVTLAGNAKGTVENTNRVAGIVNNTGYRPSDILTRTIPGVERTVYDGRSINSMSRTSNAFSSSMLDGGSYQSSRINMATERYGGR